MADQEEPHLLMQECDCGKPNCKSVIIAMINPVIKSVDGTDALVPVVHFPLDQAQGFVDYLRKMARQRGVYVR